MILKLYQDASSSRINFSKVKPYELEHIKIELTNQDKGVVEFSIKMPGVRVENSIFDNSNCEYLLGVTLRILRE